MIDESVYYCFINIIIIVSDLIRWLVLVFAERSFSKTKNKKSSFEPARGAARSLRGAGATLAPVLLSVISSYCTLRSFAANRT